MDRGHHQVLVTKKMASRTERRLKNCNFRCFQLHELLHLIWKPMSFTEIHWLAPWNIHMFHSHLHLIHSPRCFFRFISKKNVDTRRFKYMFTPTCKNYPIWLIVLRWVETTNELFFSFIDFGHDLIFGSHLLVVVFALLFSLLLLITLWRFSMVKSVIFPGNLRCMRWSGGICTISRP